MQEAGAERIRLFFVWRRGRNGNRDLTPNLGWKGETGNIGWDRRGGACSARFDANRAWK